LSIIWCYLKNVTATQRLENLGKFSFAGKKNGGKGQFGCNGD
jgi:hypothetical protein